MDHIYTAIKGSFESSIPIDYISITVSSNLVHRAPIKLNILVNFRISLISPRISAVSTLINFASTLFLIKNTKEYIRFVTSNLIRMEWNSHMTFIDELEQILEISSYFTQIY